MCVYALGKTSTYIVLSNNTSSILQAHTTHSRPTQGYPPPPAKTDLTIINHPTYQHQKTTHPATPTVIDTTCPTATTTTTTKGWCIWAVSPTIGTWGVPLWDPLGCGEWCCDWEE